MRRIISTRIIYEISGRAEAAYISEFLKMCGVLVIERDLIKEQMQYEILTQEFCKYDFNLFLGIQCIDYPDYFIKDCQGNCDICAVFDYSEGFTDYLIANNFTQLRICLERVICKIFNCTSQVLLNLVRLYVHEEYCKNSFLKRFFSNTQKGTIQQCLYKKFLGITNEIHNLDSKDDKDAMPYLLYAEALCSKKVNELCDAMQKNFYYPLNKMVDKCLNIVNLAGEFPSAYMLAAMFCSCDRALYASVIPFFYDALKGRESKPCSAMTYYKYGQYLEKKKFAPDKANIIYQKSLEADSLYFRSIFKKAAELFHKKEYLQAVEFYKKIITILKNKYNIAQLFPIEIEYLCKCYSMIGLIYEYYLNDTLRASKYYKSMIVTVETQLKDTIYFKAFLCEEEGEEYREILKQKISKRSELIIEKYK